MFCFPYGIVRVQLGSANHKNSRYVSVYVCYIGKQKKVMTDIDVYDIPLSD